MSDATTNGTAEQPTEVAGPPTRGETVFQLPNLFELSAERKALYWQIAQADGELTPEVEAALDALDEQIETKIERTVFMVRNFQSDAEQIETRAESFELEAKRLKKKSVTLRAAGERLSEYVKRCMQQAELKKIDAGTFKLWIQKTGSPIVTLKVPLEALPKAFVIEPPKPEPKFNKDAYLAALKATSEQLEAAAGIDNIDAVDERLKLLREVADVHYSDFLRIQ